MLVKVFLLRLNRSCIWTISQGHELLQTVARVNRIYPNKTHGLIVDYCGVALHLKKALAIYTEDDVKCDDTRERFATCA